jgi:phosphoglucomutase
MLCTGVQLDAGEVGVQRFGDFEVEVFDSSSDYVSLLKSIFDFPALRTFLARPDFKFIFDGMHGGKSVCLAVLSISPYQTPLPST